MSAMVEKSLQPAKCEDMRFDGAQSASTSDAALPTPGWWRRQRLLRQTLRADIWERRNAQLPAPVGRSVWLPSLASIFSRPPDVDAPIFIIGSPRSGTTFLGNCLAALSAVSFHFEPVITKRLARTVFLEEWPEAKAAAIYRQVYGVLMRYYRETDRIFCEKTPRNCFIIPFLNWAFPDARFIYIVRDGRDAALSHSKKPWLQAESAQSGRFEPGGYPYGPRPRFWVEDDRREEFLRTSNLHRCAWNWRVFNEAATRDLRTVPARRTLALRYEDLVQRPEAYAEQLFQFLCLSDTQSCSEMTAAMGKARRTSVGNWRRELSATEIDLIHGECGAQLRASGYSIQESCPRP